MTLVKRKGVQNLTGVQYEVTHCRTVRKQAGFRCGESVREGGMGYAVKGQLHL